MRKALTIVLLGLATLAGADTTIDNDSSCDISQLPAATLLLPYFEVDLSSPAGTGENTLFTVSNVTELPQVAHVTLWTDYAYPVLDFNIFLTGYDVQSINLYDVIRRGRIAPDDGTGLDVSPVGELSGDHKNHVPFNNPTLDEHSCNDLPVQLPAVYITRMQSAFTIGKVPAAGSPPACNTAGGVHMHAIGYATIDVVGACAAVMPTDAAYYSDLIRFDNVLTGDYMQVDAEQNHAQGGPLVHIRAIPEGGTPSTRAENPEYAVDLPRTFYSRFQPAHRPGFDARQPLPATFFARWISGGVTSFETFYKIWREARSTSSTVCSGYPAAGGAIPFLDAVRFDEEENPETLEPEIVIPEPITLVPVLPATSLVNVQNDSIFPPNTFAGVAGWMYLNLDHDEGDAVAGQAWVISSMRAEDRFSVDSDATALGNGCSAPIPVSNAIDGSRPIGPAPNNRP